MPHYWAGMNGEATERLREQVRRRQLKSQPRYTPSGHCEQQRTPPRLLPAICPARLILWLRCCRLKRSNSLPRAQDCHVALPLDTALTHSNPKEGTYTGFSCVFVVFWHAIDSFLILRLCVPITSPINASLTNVVQFIG